MIRRSGHRDQLSPRRAAPRGDGAQWRRRQALLYHRGGLERPSALDQGACGRYQRIAYTVRAYEKAPQEWEWCEAVCLWAFRFPWAQQTYQDYFTFVTPEFHPQADLYRGAALCSRRALRVPGAVDDADDEWHLDREIGSLRAWRLCLPLALLVLGALWLVLRLVARGVAARRRPGSASNATGRCRVGMDASYPPFEVDDADGRFYGYDVDLARRPWAGAGAWRCSSSTSAF